MVLECLHFTLASSTHMHSSPLSIPFLYVTAFTNTAFSRSPPYTARTVFGGSRPGVPVREGPQQAQSYLLAAYLGPNWHSDAGRWTYRSTNGTKLTCIAPLDSGISLRDMRISSGNCFQQRIACQFAKPRSSGASSSIKIFTCASRPLTSLLNPQFTSLFSATDHFVQHGATSSGCRLCAQLR